MHWKLGSKSKGLQFKMEVKTAAEVMKPTIIVKILIIRVKPSVPCRALRHVKEPKSDVEVATFGTISRP
jgi:hypothetical protein